MISQYRLYRLIVRGCTISQYRLFVRGGTNSHCLRDITRENHYIFLPPLDTDASQFDISSRARYSFIFKNMEIWEKRARNLVAINSHADLFSLAVYQCLHQESMSVNALSRILEAVAKSIKACYSHVYYIGHRIISDRHNAAITSPKILMDHSSQELRNALINSQQLFDSKVKEVAKSNLETEQHRFLASSAKNTN